MIFDLVHDFADALNAMPRQHPRYRILQLLDEAIRRDVHFIDRHPTTLFQCMWNTCWWYDCPEAEKYYEAPTAGWSRGLPPWETPGARLSSLLQQWRAARSVRPRWFRSIVPPAETLGAGRRGLLLGHGNLVWSVQAAPDGRHIVSASYDGTVRIWDVSTGRQLVRIASEQERVEAIACSPDGQKIALAGKDASICIWDFPSGEPIARVQLEDHAPKPDFEGAEDWTPHSTAVTWSPDSKWIAASCGFSVIIVDAKSLNEIQRLVGHNGETDGLVFSRDGQWLASAGIEGTIRLWEMPGGRELACIRGHTRAIKSLAVTPDNRRLVSASSDCTVRVWDIESRSEVACLRGHRDTVWSAAISPDGKWIASASSDQTTRVWHASTGQQLLGFDDYWEWTLDVAFTRDGERIISSHTNGNFQLLDPTGDRPPTLRGHDQRARGVDVASVCDVVFFPDGRRIVSAGFDKTLRIWSVETGLELACLTGHTEPVSGVALPSKGSRLYSWDETGNLLVWNLSTLSAEQSFKAHQERMSSLSFSPDESTFQTFTSEGQIRIWLAATLERVAEIDLHVHIWKVEWDHEATSVRFATYEGPKRWHFLSGVVSDQRADECLAAHTNAKHIEYDREERTCGVRESGVVVATIRTPPYDLERSPTDDCWAGSGQQLYLFRLDE